MNHSRTQENLADLARPVNTIQTVEKFIRYGLGGITAGLGVLTTVMGNPLGIPLITTGAGFLYAGKALDARVKLNNEIVAVEEKKAQNASKKWFQQQSQAIAENPYPKHMSYATGLITGSGFAIASIVAGLNWMWAVPAITIGAGLTALAEYWLRNNEVALAYDTVKGIKPKDKSKGWFVTAGLDIFNSIYVLAKNPIYGLLTTAGVWAQTYFNYKTYDSSLTHPAVRTEKKKSKQRLATAPQPA